ncbi:MAG: hypothetical protein ACK40S_03525 [Burkholderiaceae bacterium]
MAAATTPPLRPAGFGLLVRGRVCRSYLRTTPAGAPVAVLELEDVASGQVVTIRHPYTDASPATAHAASRLLALRGQHIEVAVQRPRFTAARLVCEADFILWPAAQAGRKDLS